MKLNKLYSIILLFFMSISLFSCKLFIKLEKKIEYEFMNCYGRYISIDNELKLFEDYDSFLKFYNEKPNRLGFFDVRINDDFFVDSNLLYVPFVYQNGENKFDGGIVFEEIVKVNDIVKVRISVGLDVINGPLPEATEPYVATINYLVKIPKFDIYEDNYCLETFVRGDESKPAANYRNY